MKAYVGAKREKSSSVKLLNQKKKRILKRT